MKATNATKVSINVLKNFMVDEFHSPYAKIVNCGEML